MKTDEVKDILQTLLCDTLSMEEQIEDALPKMEKAASSPQLAEKFRTHLEETKQQIERLKQAHDMMDIDAKNVTCDVTKALIDEGEIMFNGCEEGPVRDAALIIAAQKVEHLEIAAYGSIVALARALGYVEAAELLDISLQEEKRTDEALNALAFNDINSRAVRQAA